MKNILPKPKEKDIQQACINYLKYKGFFTQRMNSGSIRTAAGGMVKLAAKGTPDVMAFKRALSFREGVMSSVDLIFLEIKVPGKKPTPAQTMMMEELESFGAQCYVIHGLNELQEVIDKYEI